MKQFENARLLLAFALSISLFGLFISLLLALYPPAIREDFIWRKPLVGSVFGLICVLGMFAAVSPKRCSAVNDLRGEEENLVSGKAGVTVAGHHLQCAEFSSHVIHIRNHTICAACTGLFIGAFMNLIGVMIYFFFERNIGVSGFAAVVVGTMGVILGFLQLVSSGPCRLAMNVLFVFGAFMILAGVDKITQSLLVDLFLISLIVFWIWTRIILSRWDHSRTCVKCKSRSECAS